MVMCNPNENRFDYMIKHCLGKVSRKQNIYAYWHSWFFPSPDAVWTKSQSECGEIAIAALDALEKQRGKI